MAVVQRLLIMVLLFLVVVVTLTKAQDLPPCNALQMGQFSCETLTQDDTTGADIGCFPNKTAFVSCTVFNGVECTGLPTYTIAVPCIYAGTKSYYVALSLSVFLGIFGADRFYLGYPAFGFLKLITLGFFFAGYYIDIMLIATQVVKPADGTDYIIPLDGPSLTQVTLNNLTYYVPLS